MSEPHTHGGTDAPECTTCQPRGDNRATVEICGCSNLARAESYRRQLSNALARAERADAERRAMESRWATSLDLLSERTARLWKAEDENVRLRAALAQERPELRTLDDGTDAGGYIVPPFGAIADAVSAEIRRQAATE